MISFPGACAQWARCSSRFGVQNQLHSLPQLVHLPGQFDIFKNCRWLLQMDWFVFPFRSLDLVQSCPSNVGQLQPGCLIFLSFAHMVNGLIEAGSLIRNYSTNRNRRSCAATREKKTVHRTCSAHFGFRNSPEKDAPARRLANGQSGKGLRLGHPHAFRVASPIANLAAKPALGPK